jgi:alkyl sulfatase BDS1-like metallo-beta-lactamase superfamily hydrolase
VAGILELSATVVDEQRSDLPVHRVTQELSELQEDLALVESFGHLVALRTGEGLVVLDTSSHWSAPAVLEALRRWDRGPVRTVIYTHGHLDHVGGSGVVLAEAAAAGHPRPTVVAHRQVPTRLARYRTMPGWTAEVNRRQFGWLAERSRIGERPAGPEAMLALLDGVALPDRTYEEHLDLEVGGTPLALHHGRGETDDHTWVWLPEQRAVCCGDFVIWHFPNAGNPQKVQRYPDEWAAALRAMDALAPEMLVPAHGLPVAGRERVHRVLDDIASALETLVDQTRALMETGCRLDEVVREVRLPEGTLAKPYLRPLYDEPEFVVRNLWRLYGGWWDGNPAHLHPPEEAALAVAVTRLVGGPGVLAAEARRLAGEGELRLAGELAEWAVLADPEDPVTLAAQAEVAEARFAAATSLMAKGIYHATAAEARHRLEGGQADRVVGGST